MNSYEKFKLLCDSHGISVSNAMIQAGLSKSLATKWKQAEEFTPNADTLIKLSKFFNVAMDYWVENYDDNYVAFKEAPEIVRLSLAMQNMTPAQRTEVLHYAQYICPDAFKR